MKLPAGELFPQISMFCLNVWQDIWDCCEGNKLHSIYPTVGSLVHSKNMSHYDSVLINRLRIGHSRLTHSHILCGADPPTCQLCGLPVSMVRVRCEIFNLLHFRSIAQRRGYGQMVNMPVKGCPSRGWVDGLHDFFSGMQIVNYFILTICKVSKYLS